MYIKKNDEIKLAIVERAFIVTITILIHYNQLPGVRLWAGNSWSAPPGSNVITVLP